MTFHLGLRLRFGLLAIVGISAFGACATEEYVFVDPEDYPSHCFNGTIDGDLGETALNCGGDCAKCQNGEACREDGDCAGGMCIDLFCQSANCNNDERDGDESDEDCGGGCRPCDTGQTCNDNDDCLSDVCTSEGTCAEATCSDMVRNGTETGVDCGGDRCSACPTGSPCLSPIDCQSGICGGNGTCSVVCQENWDECDGDTSEPSLECETNLLTDPDHCGGCGNVCNPLHAEPECISGACTVGSCEEPFDDCDNYATNGCEINLSSDAENCGSCGMACLAINGEPRCEGGECRIDCQTGFGDCNGDARDGCEKAVTSDVNNCNGCGMVCPEQDGYTAYCVGGTCGETMCPDGFGNCNGEPDDECEQSLLDSVENCGSCGNLCVVANGTPACVDGQCVVASCSDGFGNCNADDADGGYSDGCEMNTNEDTLNCGGCGEVCSVENGVPDCNDGECVIRSCATGFADCNGDNTSCETNINTSKEFCGGCNSTPCDALFPNGTGVCTDGRCEFDRCNGNFDDCDGSATNGCETDLRITEAHCNRCNQECSTAGTDTNLCLAGVCTADCRDKFLDCDDDGRNGCEIDGATDAENCGECGTRCQSVGGSNVCNDGVCDPTCTAPNADCDTSRANGCETNTNTSKEHCGGCGTACGTANTTSTTCTSGTCAPSCSPGWGACTNPAAGCTDNLNTPQRCGNCSTSCGGSTPYCVGGSCGSLLVNSGTTADSQTTNTIGFNHTLQTGDNQNRLVLLALVTQGSSAANAAPSTITYAGQTMTGGPAQHGSNGVYTRFYYRLENQLPNNPGTYPVVVTLANSSSRLAAEVLEFRGIHQTTPIEAFVNGGGNENFCNGTLFTSTLLVQTKGAYIYSLAALEWGDGREPQAPDPHGGLIQTFKRSEHRNLLPVGGYLAAANAVNYTVGWTAVCSHYTHQVIALRPATALP